MDRNLHFYLLAGLCLFLSGPAARAGSHLAGGEAAAEAYRAMCEDHYAAFEASVAARRSAEGVVYDKLGRIVDRHARFAEINDADNARFVALARKANGGEPVEARTFLFSENAVLKELNDKIVQDKDLVTALTNLRKHLEHFHLQLDPEIRPRLVGQYSDFKVHQIALDTKDPRILALVEKKIERMNLRFAEYLESVAREKGWNMGGQGNARDIRRWFHSGAGASPDESALAARFSRTQTKEGEVPRLISFAEAQAALEKAAAEAERLRSWADSRFASVEGVLVDAGDGKRVLSAEAIEAVKKVTPAGPGREALLEAIQVVFQKRFRTTIEAGEADALLSYLELADRFSPALLLESRVVINMGQAARGVISADFKGQNARNLEETMKALVRSEGKGFSERVKEVRRGEEIATRALEAKKARFQRVLARIRPGLQAEFSGDDGMGFLQTAFTEEDQLRFSREWRAQGGGADDLRLTFEEFRYGDTGRVIPAEERSRFVVAAESMEKKLREKLIGPLSRQELNATQILVSLEARENGPAVVRVKLLGPGSLHGEAEKIARSVAGDLGFSLGGWESVKFP